MTVFNGRLVSGVARTGVRAMMCAFATAMMLGSVGAAQNGTSPSAKELFQQARHQEDAVGNLDAAIQIYRRVLAASPDRALAADAQLRIGLCLEKLGRPEARQAFEVVIATYADQPTTVAEARTRLARQALASGSMAAGAGVDAIQLAPGGDIEGDAALSPDGRYLVYASWTDGTNLHVKDLSTGAVRRLTTGADAGANARNNVTALSPVFSPDGKQIAFVWHTTDDDPSLRIVDRDGSNLRVLAQGPTIGFPYAWSPDGRQIAINLYLSGQRRLGLVSVADGAVTPLKTTGWQEVESAKFSPDSKSLVYELAAIEGSDASGIFALSVDGTREVKVADGSSPIWTPDGRGIVFFGQRAGTSGLWLMPFVAGTVSDRPLLLRANVAGAIHGFTDDGSLFYSTRSEARDVVTVDIDQDSGGVSEPVRLAAGFSGSIVAAAWSPDGQHVIIGRGAAGGGMELVIRTLASGAERVVPTRTTDLMLPRGIKWFVDGDSILVRGRETGRPVYKRIDIRSGVQETVHEAGLGESAFIFDLSPDGRFLYHVRIEGQSAGGSVFRVMKKDLQNDQEVELHRTTRELVGVWGLTVSPDGARVALKDMALDQLLLVPTAGGPAVVVQRGDAVLDPLAWTRDGRYIIGARTEHERDYAWLLPATGGTPRRLNVSAANILSAAVSPSDGRVAFSTLSRTRELWLARNLLKPATAR